jgi:hypothetical protein
MATAVSPLQSHSSEGQDHVFSTEGLPAASLIILLPKHGIRPGCHPTSLWQHHEGLGCEQKNGSLKDSMSHQHLGAVSVLQMQQARIEAGSMKDDINEPSFTHKNEKLIPGV